MSGREAGIARALTELAAGEPAPGFVAAARWPGGSYLGAFGRRGVSSCEAMPADALFWIASMTKLVTAITALQLIDDSRLTLDQPVADILPDFADLPILAGFDETGAPRLRKATDRPAIRHLLTHTSGCAYVFMDDSLAKWAEHTGASPGDGRRQPRLFGAGTGWQYGVSSEWLGAVIEAVTGDDLETVFQRQILGPLELADTTLAPSPAQKARAAEIHACLPDGGWVATQVPLPPPPDFASGGAGLYSTASDYLRLLVALIDGEILSDSTRASLFVNQTGDLAVGALCSSMPAFTRPFELLPGVAKGQSFGFPVNLEPVPGGRAALSGGWAGLANCYYWIDPSSGVAGVLMCQVLPFADPRILALCDRFEKAVYE